jgi:hypothetical protein
MIKLLDILFETQNYVRNSRGEIIGSIMTQHNGRQIFRDKKGKLLGTYEPISNNTRDYTGKVVGRGNILAYLIKAYV